MKIIIEDLSFSQELSVEENDTSLTKMKDTEICSFILHGIGAMMTQYSSHRKVLGILIDKECCKYLNVVRRHDDPALNCLQSHC